MNIEYEFIGVHYIASYNQCEEGKIGDIEKIREIMIDAVNASGATLLGKVDYVFKNPEENNSDGYTLVLLLSESHASIHTYPEKNSCFIDLFTCGTKCSYEHFDKVLKEYFNPTNVCCKVIKRDDKENNLIK